MKKLLQTLTLLSARYVSIDDFKNGLLQDEALEAALAQGKVAKKKKRYSFKNPDNLK